MSSILGRKNHPRRRSFHSNENRGHQRVTGTWAYHIGCVPQMLIPSRTNPLFLVGSHVSFNVLFSDRKSTNDKLVVYASNWIDPFLTIPFFKGIHPKNPQGTTRVPGRPGITTHPLFSNRDQPSPRRQWLEVFFSCTLKNHIWRPVA